MANQVFKFSKHTYDKYVNGIKEQGNIVVGISGIKTAGKTTLADKVSDTLNGIGEVSADVRSMATPVKRIVNAAIEVLGGEDISDIYGVDLGEHKEAKRPFYQFIGTEFGREFLMNEIWVMRMLYEIYTMGTWGHNKRIIFIIDDIRFENEIRMIQDLGGINVFIEHNIDNTDSHSSENIESIVVKHPPDLVVNRNDSLSKKSCKVIDLVNTKLTI